MVRRLLDEVERPDLGEAATLVVSEVVTNAVLHAGTPVDVSLSYDHRGLHVRVGDGSTHLPTRRRYGATAGTGRGLLLLEHLVDEWGVIARVSGKTVWFRLSATDSERAANGHPVEASATDHGGIRDDALTHPMPRRVPDTDLEVELRNMPLLLHSAWQEYAETLLREYLLLTIDVGDGAEDPIQVHARATSAIAVLEEHVPRAQVAFDPEQLMQDATEPRVSGECVRLPVPESALADFHTLDTTIEHGLRLARDGRLLTPPSQPEIQEFRRWVCAQVRLQSVGAEPVAWSMERQPMPQPAIDLRWDSARVTGAEIGLIAADEANIIVAASRAALDILGYETERDLVGHRIVSIIPDRFRQAHVAGFMMFLLTGRRPLLGVPVTVPALRRDGTEVSIELTVTVESVGQGQSVFVAELSVA